MLGLLFSLCCFMEKFDNFTEDVTWLSKNIYFEAGNQLVEGKKAVADVTLNRVKDKRFPNTVKGVVTQSKTTKHWKTGESIPVRNACMFSWYCDGKVDTIPKKDIDIYFEIIMFSVTYILFNEYIPDDTKGSTHYHADYVHPYWAEEKQYVSRIGDHLFYRWN